MTVRTRFAPSPTGYLHIGGVWAALFAWLYARRHGGQFLLRIEDTDTKRTIPGALESLMTSLRWFGIEWDEVARCRRALWPIHPNPTQRVVPKMGQLAH
ncbi:MAG: hypothetical protein IPJ90_07465 [Anaerolineaceae bacterium]|nr:hypothetical protein [Anaerolineaceae bacterium]